MKRRVGELWDSFERRVLPRNCSEVQRTETRRAFYAGAFGVLDELGAALSQGDELTAEDEQMLQDMAQERAEYLTLLLEGKR